MIDGVVIPICDLVKQSDLQLEEYLASVVAYLGITPEKFAERYELEVHHGSMSIEQDSESDTMLMAYTSRYRLRLKD